MNSTKLKSLHNNEAEQDALFQSMLDAAHKADRDGDFDSAERKFEAACAMALETCGERSWEYATSLFHQAAFYSAHHRELSARACFERMQKVMRW